MKQGILLFISLSLLGSLSSATLTLNQRCIADLPNEPQVYSSDFKWNMTLEEIRQSAEDMYKSNKRLAKRAYLDESTNTFVFPNLDGRGGLIKIPQNFIKAVQKHVEKAFERNYIDAVLFPDMGHSHFLVPMEYYKKEIEPIPVSQYNLLYEKIMEHPYVKVVYHTAEQLKMLDSENRVLTGSKYIQWRYFTRNLVGHNNVDPDIEIVNATDQSDANTLREVSGYRWWGGGFNIHANQNACFEFKRDGKTYYFDLSLEDLHPSPDAGGIFSDVNSNL